MRYLQMTFHINLRFNKIFYCFIFVNPHQDFLCDLCDSVVRKNLLLFSFYFDLF